MTNYLKFLIEVDRKSTSLKSIQGKIWQAGYESGELKSVMFEDVPQAFERWKREGKTIAIFSSGSVLAQKLIFKYSNFGDLSGFIDDYFDTNVGAKKESQSFENIAGKLRVRNGEILFISDISEELNAARKAGLEAFLCIREGNASVSDNHGYQIIFSFDCL